MRFFALVVILFLNCNILAQENREKIDSEIAQLKELNKKTDKTEQDIAQMLELCKEVYSREPDLVLSYLKKLKPAIEEKKYYHGWVDYCFVIKGIFSGKGKSKEAEEIITGIYNRYADYFSPEEEVSIQYYLSVIAQDLGDTEHSQEIVKAILPKARANSQKADLYYVRALNYRHMGEYEKSIEDCFKVIELNKSINNKKALAVTYNVLADIYREMKNYEKALGYSRKALELAREIHNFQLEMNIYANIGVYYRALGKIDSALYFYNLGVELARKHNRLQSVAQNLLNMGNIYLDEYHNYVEAEKYFYRSLDICYDSGIKYGIYLNWFNLGNNYWRMGAYPKAENAYDSALAYVEKLKMPPEEARVQENYYKLYKKTGDYQKALEHYEKFNDIRREMDLEQSKKEIEELQLKYDVAVKDKEIERINNKYKIQKFRNGILLLIILGAGSVIYFLVYRNRSLRKLYQRNVELSNSPFLYEVPEDTEEADPLEKIFRELVHLMQNEKIYIEPNLSVNHIAKKLNTNQKYLSNSITKYAGLNFNNFINSYRIHEAKRMMLRQPKLPVKEVMYVCGFNSKTPFYLAFQKYTGMSPQQFKDLSVSQNKKQAEEELIEA